MNLRSTLVAGIAPALLVVTGCGSNAEVSSSAPALDHDELEVLQSVTDNTNGWNWTMTAATPTANLGAAWTQDATVQASVTFTGTIPTTRKAGACLVTRVEVYGGQSTNNCGMVDEEWSTPVTCTSDAGCTAYKTVLGTGGDAYCLSPNNSGQKYCYARGPQAQWCVGSPASSKQDPIGPGTYPTGSLSAWTSVSGWQHHFYYDCREDYGGAEQYNADWLMYGCFYGCKGGDGSTITGSMSSGRYVYSDQYGQESTGTY